ncbi:phosphoribosylformylglycinamidine synthase subunit PurL [Wolbachia endosymbiont of Pentidionis agamae]|uniref:phosphoribosylformylglycinamidine synthase subunit PurL n=1 Tax=Wolbachia endosymbiont of Pentidionis agamae TaxID=3110435 RepID=UPI002FD075FC
MVNLRIEVISKDEQSGSRAEVNVYSIFIDRELTQELYKEICALFYHKTVQDCCYYLYDKSLEENEYKLQADLGLEISFLPGMTDNIGNTVRQIIKEYLISRGYDDIHVNAKSSKLILGKGDVPTEEDIRQQFNPIIEYCTLICKEENSYNYKYYGKYKSAICDTGIIRENLRITRNKVKHINLNLNDEGLESIGNYGADGNGTLGLSLPAMKAIKSYFDKLGRDPYDIELESLAQTWSEHCKHNIFSSSIDEIKDGLYEHYIKRATREINSSICISVFSDNAGAIIFDDEYLIVDKVETHNSPSALDPFGGAMTGVLGVNRDIIGFGIGAEPIMNTYYFCFASKMDGKLYRDKELTNEILSPKFIAKEVIHGVNVGGNSSGIPTQLGSLYFDDRFIGKPLVFAGSVGIIPRNINNVPAHVKKLEDGDKIVVIGGRVGRDGIHGATFSSEALSENNSSAVVQIGDPITQKKLSNAVIEARDLSLYNAITDNGAGGLSSSIGEMGKNGFEVDLSKVLLKNNDMYPWEIWISESQERMTLAVPQENLAIFDQIMKKHDVEYSIIGEFNNSGKAVVKCSQEIIMDIETEFLHNGNPKMHLQTKPWSKEPVKIKKIKAASMETALKEMLGMPNICSKEFIVVQYDHEVQGSSVLKPLQGKGRVCSEVIISRPILSSTRGIVKSQGFSSSYGEIDTYHMAACAIDTAVRNYVAAGGNINHLALLDNFCWCDAYNPERLWQLKRAARACYDYATIFKTPFISGKDSMFNDFKGYDKSGKEVAISAPPSLLISAIGIIENIENAVSLDVKVPGDLMYILGITYDEFGRSEYQLYSGVGDNNIPKVHAENARKLYECYCQAVKEGIVASAIALNLGGLIIALTKSLIAGGLGAEIDLSKVALGEIENPDSVKEIIMFSESQSRILVTIAPQNQERFEELFKNIPSSCIGVVTEEKVLSIKDTFNVKLEDLAKSYRTCSYL